MGGAAETFEAHVTESDSICPALDLCCFCTTLSVVLLGWEFQPYTIISCKYTSLNIYHTGSSQLKVYLDFSGHT